MRTADPASLDETFECMRERRGMAWIGLYRPEKNEILAVAEELHLHPLAVEDAVNAHQRPKLERYDDILFTVLRPARYLDDVERVEFGEVHVFTGPDFVVTIRQAESPDLGRVRHRLESSPELLCLGPEAVLYAVLDQVVDEYFPVVAGLENDIDEIEDQLFSGDAEGVAAHLRTVARGDRVPARDPPAAGHLRRARERLRQVRRGRRTAPRAARREGPRDLDRREGGLLPRTAAERPHGARDPRRAGAERRRCRR